MVTERMDRTRKGSRELRCEQSPFLNKVMDESSKHQGT